ncbi:MAG: prepilin peptidase, partial [Syntrophomonadaceae bacterium]
MFVLAVIACGVIDYKKYIIPNAITIPLIVAGLMLQIYQQNWVNIFFTLAAGTVTFILAAITGGMGGGDVKLIMALFLWLSPADILYIIIISSVFGIIWGT